MSGIEDLGNEAVDELVEIVPAVKKPETGKSTEGDAYIILSDDPSSTPHWLEVKGGKPNQVRPVAMLTLVFKHQGSWYVIPSPDMLAYACMLQRGQHGYDPVDCCQLNVSRRFARYRVEDPAKLADRIDAAIRSKVANQIATDAILVPYKAAVRALTTALESARKSAQAGIGQWSSQDLSEVAKQSLDRQRKP